MKTFESTKTAVPSSISLNVIKDSGFVSKNPIDLTLRKFKHSGGSGHDSLTQNDRHCATSLLFDFTFMERTSTPLYSATGFRLRSDGS